MDFIAFPKLHRLMRGAWIISEKLDGTNACVQIEQQPVTGWPEEYDRDNAVQIGADWYKVQAQSRKRLIYPGDDNYGFAAWTQENAGQLVRALGPGAHFGEWWGQGIQRRYGMDRKLFSLFNTGRWGEVLAVHEDKTPVAGLRVVPRLATIPAHDAVVFEEITDRLKFTGSFAAPGFMNPEGVVVFDTGTGTMGKWTFEGDEPKWKSQS